jgi:hypothetical protein
VLSYFLFKEKKMFCCDVFITKPAVMKNGNFRCRRARNARLEAFNKNRTRDFNHISAAFLNLGSLKKRGVRKSQPRSRDAVPLKKLGVRSVALAAKFLL